MRQKGERQEREITQSFPFIVPTHWISKEEEGDLNVFYVTLTCVDLAHFV